MKKYLLIMVSLFAILTANTVFAVSFADLTSEHWAYEPIIEMANKGILRGYPDGTFLPNKPITRAEFAKILVLSLNLKDETNINNFFDDIDSSHWSYDYVRIASNYLSGYTNGSQIYFMPDEQAVREDMAVAIVMAANLQNKQYDIKTLDRFYDKDSISESFKKYVAIAVENNLMRGNANGTFNPKGKLTRAEVSQLMFNTTKELEKIVVSDTELNNEQENKNELKTKVSTNKKSGTSLKSSDSIELYSEGTVFQYKVIHGNQVIMKSLYKNNDILKVSDIMKNAEKLKIMLLGEEIKLVLNIDDTTINHDDSQDVIYTYKIVPDIEFELTPKDGSILKTTDEVTLKTKGNFDIEEAYSDGGVFDYYYQVYYNNTHFCVGSFISDGTIKVSKMIEDASIFNYNLSGKDVKIVVSLLWSSMDGSKNLYKKEFGYTIQTDFVLLSAHPDAIYKGNILKSDNEITLKVSGNSDIKTFNYKIYHLNTLLSKGTFRNSDILYVSDIINRLNDIHIAEGEIILVLYYDDTINGEEKYMTRYTYNVEP